MAADCSFFFSSMAFMTVCAPYCSADGSALLILPLVNGLHDGFRTVMLRGWQRIAHSCNRRRFSRWLAHRLSQRMAVDCSFFLSSMALTMVFVRYCSADGRGLLILPLIDYHNCLRAIMLVGSLAGSIILPLIRGFANRLHAVWLDGR